VKYIIWGEYDGREKEELDEFESADEADRMIEEYALAFGPDWKLWKERVNAR